MRKMTFWLILMAFLALFLVACGGGDDGGAADEAAEESAAAEDALVGDAAAGESKFQATCSACHGPDAKGMPNLGKDMTISEFIADSSDAELLAFVKVGRPPGDPANTTGVDMPAKGTANVGPLIFEAVQPGDLAWAPQLIEGVEDESLEVVGVRSQQIVPFCGRQFRRGVLAHRLQQTEAAAGSALLLRRSTRIATRELIM